MAIDSKEECEYYLVEQKKAAEKLLSKDGHGMIMSLLRRAFTEGYNAKHDYSEAQKILKINPAKKKQVGKKCKCACHKTKDKEKGTCKKCYMIQCSWWKGRNFAYATREGLWIGDKERNR